jgi:[1-hydroxy-2-(trimethylamino)ethyl]phosphonate dioxygenase
MPSHEDTRRELGELYLSRANGRYGLEHISQLQHALQTAAQAEAHGETPALILAALLHDVGHLVCDMGDNPAADSIDNAHERVGAHWLAQRFGHEISEPVRLHVAAKRYLCATEPDYRGALAPDSVTSLALQGGPMSDAEAREFLRLPFAAEAIRLRRFDERAKDVDANPPPLAHFLRYVEALA